MACLVLILESGLDFAPIDERSNPHLEDGTPIIVVQHGLTGGGSEPDLRSEFLIPAL